MNAEIISKTGSDLTIQVKISLKNTMLDSEQAILESVNEVGKLATGEALKQFDTDGEPIILGGIKFTSRTINNKDYQSPYGVVPVDRHVYQTSKGGKIYVPLNSGARIIQGATPRFAKMLSHKYTNMPVPGVIEDMNENHDRKIARSYVQNVTDYVGSVAQMKEECWEYENPILESPVTSIGISLDGAYINTVDEGYREGMVGAITFYENSGERLHTTYIAAASEYGKEKFFERFEREIERTKVLYQNVEFVGIADGAKNNWPFLEKHTTKQILDFWHATEYLAEASHAVFTKKIENVERKEWLDQQCHDLKHKKGAATRILNILKENTTKRLKKVVKEDLDSAITYFSNNIKAGRMRYYNHVENNLPIGSGVIEAACKTIIKQRLCGSGMRWKDNGMKMILSLRSLVKTESRWNQFWDKINMSGVPTYA